MKERKNNLMSTTKRNSEWKLYNCIDGCGRAVFASSPSRCVRCREIYWREKKGMAKPGKKRFHNYREVLLFIANYKKDNYGKSPSIREIRDGCELYSTSTTVYILDTLEKNGKIKRDGNHRSIKLVGERYFPPRDL